MVDERAVSSFSTQVPNMLLAAEYIRQHCVDLETHAPGLRVAIMP